MGKSTENSYLEQLARKRAPAIEAVATMVERGEYKQAIDTVRRVDNSIDGDVALAKLLEATSVRWRRLGRRRAPSGCASRSSTH
jgi:hypothetical protein